MRNVFRGTSLDQHHLLIFNNFIFPIYCHLSWTSSTERRPGLSLTTVQSGFEELPSWEGLSPGPHPVFGLPSPGSAENPANSLLHPWCPSKLLMHYHWWAYLYQDSPYPLSTFPPTNPFSLLFGCKSSAVSAVLRIENSFSLICNSHDPCCSSLESGFRYHFNRYQNNVSLRVCCIHYLLLYSVRLGSCSPPHFTEKGQGELGLQPSLPGGRAWVLRKPIP